MDVGTTEKNGKKTEVKGKMKKFLIAVCLTIILLVAGLFGCSGRKEVDPAKTSHATVSDVAMCSPVKIAEMIDKTGSSNRTRTPTPRAEDFEPLINLLKRCGGELAVGLISDESNRGLLRVAVDSPPPKPQVPEATGNPFRDAKVRGQSQKSIQEYETRLSSWQEVVDKNLKDFRDQLRDLLSTPANAPRTDIWGAVHRLDLFLAEPESCGGAKKYAILLSDGIDNQKKQRHAPRGRATWLVVNGTPAAAALSELAPTYFESVEAAHRFIITENGG